MDETTPPLRPPRRAPPPVPDAESVEERVVLAQIYISLAVMALSVPSYFLGFLGDQLMKAVLVIYLLGLVSATLVFLMSFRLTLALFYMLLTAVFIVSMVYTSSDATRIVFIIGLVGLGSQLIHSIISWFIKWLKSIGR